MNYPSVSVIILNYNGMKNLGEFLHTCLSSVLKSKYPNFDVIFVDNGSTDSSVEFVNERFRGDHNLKIVMNAENYGFAMGNNFGFRHAHGEYIIFLNNDAEVEPHWIKELVKVMEADPTIGAAQSKIVSMDRLHIQTVGNLLDLALLTYLMGYNEEDKGQYNKICEITYASGAAFIIRRSLIDKMGLFDPKYFFYHDDCDLGLRVRMAGSKIVMVPSSIVFHKGGATSISTLKNNQTFFFLASRFGLLIKNYQYKNILKFGGLMIIGILLDVLELFRQRNLRVPQNFLVWAFREFRYNWQKRLESQLRIRKIDDDEILKTFLDSSILKLRLTRHFSRLWSGELNKYFDKFVNETLYNYYLNHIYSID